MRSRSSPTDRCRPAGGGSPSRDTGRYHCVSTDDARRRLPDAPRRDLPLRPDRRARRAPRTSTASASSSTTRPPSAPRGSATSPGPRPSARMRRRPPRRPVARLGGEPGARRPVGEHPGRCTWRGPAARSRGFTVPAINIRAQTFDMARTIFETAAAADVGAVILELARSEQTYTFQRPIDYATSVLAGAIAAGWQGPVFIQGDHYQFNAKKYAADPESMTEEIRRACRLAIDAGYRNIDIDSSTLVDLSKPNVDEEQRENYSRAAELTALIRSLEPDGVTVSVGGEIGEVGKQNSTERGAARVPRRASARARRPGARRAGISKVSVQTGTSATAACRCPTAASPRSSSTSRSSASSASSPREYGLAGAVQHGASTLPDELFHRFPEVETAEIHLATGFQNALYEHPAFPASSTSRSRLVLRQRRSTSARPTRRTSSSCTRRARRRSVRSSASCGTSPTKDEILADQGRKIGFLFRELGVDGTRAMVDALHPAGRVPSAAPGCAPGRRRPLIAWPGCRPGRGSRTPMLGLSVDSSLTRRNTVLSSRPSPRPDGGIRRGRAQAILASLPGGQSRTGGAEGRRRNRVGSSSPQDVAARDDAHLRSLGIKPELRRTLGFLANFAIAFSFISVSTGSFGNFGVGLGLGGPVIFWSGDRHRARPDAGRARVRRAGEPLPGGRLHLPVVEAPVEPDARLVHGLVLLLGPGRDGHRRGGASSPSSSTASWARPELPRQPVAARPGRHVHVHRRSRP